jgi:hypothetical protein
MFDYNPENDHLLPCQDIGLQFKRGDILEVRAFRGKRENICQSTNEVGYQPEHICIL